MRARRFMVKRITPLRHGNFKFCSFVQLGGHISHSVDQRSTSAPGFHTPWLDQHQQQGGCIHGDGGLGSIYRYTNELCSLLPSIFQSHAKGYLDICFWNWHLLGGSSHCRVHGYAGHWGQCFLWHGLPNLELGTSQLVISFSCHEMAGNHDKTLVMWQVLDPPPSSKAKTATSSFIQLFPNKSEK